MRQAWQSNVNEYMSSVCLSYTGPPPTVGAKYRAVQQCVLRVGPHNWQYRCGSFPGSHKVDSSVGQASEIAEDELC